jgi:uncharacterized membrane protein YebE (DUF533 family)
VGASIKKRCIQMKRILLLAAVTAVSSATAFAQSATPGVDARQANQQQRIDQGVSSGQLNAREASRLQRGQARVQAMETKAKSDGKVTAAERARLRKAQNVQSARIAKQKHDAHRAR